MSSYLLPALLLALAWPCQAQSYGTFGFDTSGMDRTIAAGDDWIRFASGVYLDKLVIPGDRSNFGERVKLSDLSQERSRTILEAAGRSSRPEEFQVGNYYASFMDEAGIEIKGMSPFKGELDRIEAITDRKHLATAFGRFMRLGINLPLAVEVEQDMKDPGLVSVYLSQSGLGMPDRDYYLNPKFAEVRVKYLGHITAMLRLAGMKNPESRAKGIMALETRIAETHWSRVAVRQEENRYNPVLSAEIGTFCPGLEWVPFLEAVRIHPKTFIASQPSALQGTAKLIASEPLITWKDYLVFHALSSAAPYLAKAVVEERFAFYDKVLSGQLQPQPRWKRGVDNTSQALPEAVGKLYVAQYFPPETKRQVDLMVKNFLAAMDERLVKLTWMDAGTKVEARAKLARFTAKIGYPDTWRDYSKLDIRSGDALGNAWRANEFEYQRNLDKVGKPIDRSEWGMTPMTVNAYANFYWNEIVFPAAILQPPCFDPKADPAVNYGAIGSVIGHELSHHFDDQGRKYDKNGTLADWWKAEDVKRFQALTGQVVRQYDAYEPLPGRHVNGELTLGENMADLAGLNIALDAYHKSLAGKPAPILDGFTGDQRFFLGFAQMRCMKYRDNDLIRRLSTDPHTPSFLRAKVVRNLDAWYKAFGVREGQKEFLAPAERIKIW